MFQSIIVLNAVRNSPEPGQTMAEVLVDDVRWRYVVRFRDNDGVDLIEHGGPLEHSANAWWAVRQVLARVDDGEAISFPLDVTEEARQGPWTW